MPYIGRFRRIQLRLLLGTTIDNPGELNYVFTQMAERYRAMHGDSYSTFNDIVGALALASSEFQRRVVAPYEDRKLKENGDVYAPLEDSHDDTHDHTDVRGDVPRGVQSGAQCGDSCCRGDQADRA